MESALLYRNYHESWVFKSFVGLCQSQQTLVNSNLPFAKMYKKYLICQLYLQTVLRGLNTKSNILPDDFLKFQHRSSVTKG